MNEIIKPIGDDLTSNFRLVCYLTPSSFNAEIICISTIWIYEEDPTLLSRGSTWIGKVESMNSFTAEKMDKKYKKVASHKSIEEAVAFHNKTILEASH